MLVDKCWSVAKILKAKNILEEADDEARELLEVLLAAELGVEQHDQVAGVGLGWPRLQIGIYLL